MERVFADPDVLLAYHNATLIDASGNSLGRLYRGLDGWRNFAPLTRHPWIVVPGFAQVFRRSLMRFSTFHDATFDIDWPQEPLAHDQWFALLASVLGHIVFVRNPLAQYRQHGANTFGAYPDRKAHLYRLARGEKFITLAAHAARNRADLFERIQMEASERERDAIQRGIAYYDALSRSLEARGAVYGSRTMLARLAALWRLVRAGAYSRRNGSARFNGWDFLMDANLAVPFGPRLQRLLPW